MTPTINDASAYGVKIIPATVETGELYWQIVNLHHLTPEENQKRHHLFLDAVDEKGNRLNGTSFIIRWDGGSELITLDESAAALGANFPIWKWQICSVAIAGAPSDSAVNLHTEHPDEGKLNTLFHHSFAIKFVRTVATGAEAPAYSALRGYLPQGQNHKLELWDESVMVKTMEIGEDHRYHFDNLPAGLYALRDRTDGRLMGPFTLDGRHDVVADFPVSLPEGKLFTHYFLLGEATAPKATVYTSLLADYLTDKHRTFGFDVKDATKAITVHLIGPQSEATLQALKAAGCTLVQLPEDPHKLLRTLQN